MTEGAFGAGLNHSDAWLASTSTRLESFETIDPARPRRVFLDKECEVYCLVSPWRYEWVTRWRWTWRWDRTKTKRYAVRNTSRNGARVTLYMHEEILNATGKVQPSEAHTIGDHQNGESLDNQDHNLEWATKSQNRRNRKR